MYLFIIDCANPGSYEGGAAFVDDERISFEKNAVVPYLLSTLEKASSRPNTFKCGPNVELLPNGSF